MRRALVVGAVMLAAVVLPAVAWSLEAMTDGEMQAIVGSQACPVCGNTKPCALDLLCLPSHPMCIKEGGFQTLTVKAGGMYWADPKLGQCAAKIKWGTVYCTKLIGGCGGANAYPDNDHCP